MSKRFPKKKYIVDSNGCWIWQLYRSGKYGKCQNPINRRTVWAHRYMYELLKGPIPDDMDLHHLCEVTLCVNPDHLQITSRRENILLSRVTKISDETVREIRNLRKLGWSRSRLAIHFNLKEHHIYDLVNFRRRKDVV